MTTEAVLQGQPRLTFACELDRARRTELFSDGSVVDDLKALGAHVILMLSDFSPEWADVVRKLNSEDIPVVGVPSSCLSPTRGGPGRPCYSA